MLKVVKVLGSQIIIGDTDTNEAMYISKDDCYEEIKEGDIVEVFKGEGITIVTLKESLKEKPIISKQKPVMVQVEKTDSHRVNENIIEHKPLKQESSSEERSKQESKIVDVKEKVEPMVESLNKVSRPKPVVSSKTRKVYPLMMVSSIITAILLAIVTHTFLGSYLVKVNRESYQLMSEYYENRSEGDIRKIPPIHRFDMYSIPSVLEGEFFGQVLAIGRMVENRKPVLLICWINLHDEAADCFERNEEVD